MIYIKLLGSALLWGGTFVAGRSLAQNVGPYSGAFYRFVIGAFFLVLFVWIKNGRLSLPHRRWWLTIFLLGLSGAFAYNIFFFKGLKLLAAGRASAIIATNPIFIALFAALIFREQLTRVMIGGILISVSGALIVISRGDFSQLVDSGFGLGEIYIFGCVASWVSFSLLGRKVLTEIPPLTLIAYSAIVGAVTLFIPAILEGAIKVLEYSMWDWINLLYLGLFGTALGFVWYYEGIQKIGPTRAGLFINFVPISAVILAWFLLNEGVSASLLFGTLLVSCGAYLTNQTKKKKNMESVKENEKQNINNDMCNKKRRLTL